MLLVGKSPPEFVAYSPMALNHHIYVMTEFLYCFQGFCMVQTCPPVMYAHKIHCTHAVQLCMHTRHMAFTPENLSLQRDEGHSFRGVSRERWSVQWQASVPKADKDVSCCHLAVHACRYWTCMIVRCMLCHLGWQAKAYQATSVTAGCVISKPCHFCC